MPGLSPAALPEDAASATLAGRVWLPAAGGPAVVALRGGTLIDVSAAFPTMRDLCEAPDPAAALRRAEGPAVGTAGAVLANTPPDARDPALPWLLAPVDLQAIKAAGVTFVASMLERVIEERAKGALEAALAIRGQIAEAIGGSLRALRPGSPEAARVKELLVAQGLWSQYLEVGIGPDAEIFTKAQPMAAVGTGADIGVRPDSGWNNPEPEVVLALSAAGRAVGAMLGNDVNLRDFEGRSALLLSKAKDNNASCALGPFLRLFDAEFGMDDVRRAEVTLRVEGEDGFVLDGHSSLAEISRDPADLVAQAVNPHHQYPDGAVLFLGTMFAPTQDRYGPGQGFTHAVGDLVTIASPRLGRLVNRVRHTQDCPPWVHGTGWLMRNLAARGLLGAGGPRPPG
ncbi:fumarylacetoacetate hydrolase family protein [Roseomonas sp. NAR14]|uniref:Fumarylacetoacetate hydrolase family protein n=1 Tax=Roseomonas acroporae TaxID=2937791 RepID=A0A9X1YAU2_9PROT|nr:fumarylacetoacetate hydrolase family protein [Roseomonas acroporae]MCK8785297.1 fumarylacetoacetate hydrolase family protein [Roseomonas acroporae]